MVQDGALLRLAAEVEDDRRQAAAWAMRLAGYADELGSPGCRDEVAGFAALLLHRWYLAVEAAFERIERNLVGPLPAGGSWHRDLLRLMSLDVAGRRQAVVSAETAALLLPFLQFRDFFRRAYAVEFEPSKLHGLVGTIAGVQARLDAELGAFVGGLR